MSNPKVSVIIPNYNYRHYLEQRINSVINQTYTDYEIILLDDASTDGSCEYIQSWASHPKVSNVVINQRNSGSPFAQWKRGIELAVGDYVWIAEADDSADSHFLEKMTALLDLYADASVIYSASKMIDTDGMEMQKDYDHWNKRKIAGGGATVYDGDDFVSHNMYWRNYIYNASGVVFRRQSVTQSAFNSLNMRYCSDWLFWSEIIKKSKVIELHERLNLFRFHDNSTTKTGEYRAFVEDIDIIKRFNDMMHISYLKRKVRAGRLCRRASKMKFSKLEYDDIIRRIENYFGSIYLAKFIDVCSKFIPFVPSETRDASEGNKINLCHLGDRTADQNRSM